MTGDSLIIRWMGLPVLLIAAGASAPSSPPPSPATPASPALPAPTISSPTSPAPAAGDKLGISVAKGVEYLLSQQNGDGSIYDLPKNETAKTSLALMALASVGHLPGDSTREGVAVRRALGFVLRDDRRTPEGYFGKTDGSRMYGQGIVTLMLTEMLGMGADAGQDALIRDRCQKAVDFIVRAQQSPKLKPDDRGGWRYEPDSRDSDLSVTAWQVLALRSAKNAGLDVPKTSIDAAAEYVLRCAGRVGETQGFAYQLHGKATFETTMAGLLALQVCDRADAPEAREAAAWLHTRRWGAINFRWYFYGNYYFAQALYQNGGPGAAPGQRLLESYLAGMQGPDGAWPATGKTEQIVGNVFTTSLALLSLSVRHHFLPIYQR